MTSKNKKLAVLFAVGCICVLLVAGLAVFIVQGGFGSKNTIADGVTIGGVDVGGLTEAEAKEKVDAYIEVLENRQITILVNENEVQATAVELGFVADAQDSVQEAYQVGKSGNFFSKFRALSEADAGEQEFEIAYTVDEAVLTTYIEENCAVYDVKKKNSKLKLVNGTFKATKSRDGQKVQVEETAALVYDALLEDVSDSALTVEAVVEVKEAEYTQELVSRCQDLLGSYSTSYSSSTTARKTNVQVAANYINGTIVYPGKTFSVVKTIKDRTEENGYESAAEYSSGKVVEGIGGGVCQVSTTLYNAVLNAELEIVERSPHSMVVAYVDVSRDAAIAGDYKDFKFKNDTDVPIYIAATADGSTLTFKIYGEETRADNREISFESEIIETIEPGEAEITEDETKSADYYVVTQSAHVGYKAKLWKIITIDGVESERVQINYSVYNAEPEYITVGKQQEEATPTPSASDAATATPKKKKKKATATETPETTPTPSASASPDGTEG